MIINYVKIENFRNFQLLETTLSKLSIIIGENDSGKSNFLNALKLPLCINDLDYRSKRLVSSDFNSDSIKNFYKTLHEKPRDSLKISSSIPIIKITLRFGEIKEPYEKAIVGNWLTEIDAKPEYEIQYIFKPKNEKDFIDYALEQIEGYDEENENFSFLIPTEFYDYAIISTGNGKTIPYNELKHITINSINAERDDFSESNSMKSNSLLTKLLEKKLDEKEKIDIYKAYNEFFNQIKEQENFKKIFNQDPEFPSLNNFIEEIDCIPNLANLKNILSNITLGYGDEFLYQKGLGQRNLIFILLFFQHFKDNEACFNLSCIEEPEAHLSTNNLNLITDYIKKSVLKSKSLFQTIITSHRPELINKLDFRNVIAFSGNKAISFLDVDDFLINYLAKRPNFDILKLLFSNKVILVEGPTEEMFINTILNLNKDNLHNIDVISIGQKGFKTFLNIWLKLNEGNKEKKIGIIRDFDNQPKAKKEHHIYDNDETIFIRTTEGYTLENDIASTGENAKIISEYYLEIEDVADFLKSSKAENMMHLCNVIEKGEIKITVPKHINEVLMKLV
ncbi:ATP-dependent endonuclease [Flavobacterium sp. IB48]|uniref:ATP-dependent nuclease n=1 Tax=Flavobacterium sp. IB48 TaxID=2779375 RepID=UPI0018E81D97|nr:AAA family ATPase [Flavobacterium sp. IB48]MBJ2123412.1 AAA family ATPase [Flavobacterium sp. IB48]